MANAKGPKIGWGLRPCAHTALGVLLRYRDGRCVLCRRATKSKVNPEVKSVYNKQYREKNRERLIEYNREWRLNNEQGYREKIRKQSPKKAEAKRKKKGVVWAPGQSISFLRELQNNRCAICSRSFADLPKSQMHVDHDHAIVGKPNVRGLLCHSCNSGIGHLKDNAFFLRVAIHYIERGPLL